MFRIFNYETDYQISVRKYKFRTLNEAISAAENYTNNFAVLDDEVVCIHLENNTEYFNSGKEEGVLDEY